MQCILKRTDNSVFQPHNLCARASGQGLASPEIRSDSGIKEKQLSFNGIKDKYTNCDLLEIFLGLDERDFKNNYFQMTTQSFLFPFFILVASVVAPIIWIQHLELVYIIIMAIFSLFAQSIIADYQTTIELKFTIISIMNFLPFLDKESQEKVYMKLSSIIAWNPIFMSEFLSCRVGGKSIF